MALYLLFDTSTRDCSVALVENDDILAERFVENTRSHAKLLPTLFTEVLQEANYTINDVDALAIGEGPGSYTGLRIGFSVAKGIAYALNIPIYFIDVLHALAYQMCMQIDDSNAVCIATMKSRKGELYYSVVNNDTEILEASKPATFSNDLFKQYKNHSVYIAGNNLNDIKKNVNKLKYSILNHNFNVTNFIALINNVYEKITIEKITYKNPKYLKPFKSN